MRRVVLALLLALAVLVPAAHAATGTGTTPTLPNQFTPKRGPAQLNEKRVTAIFLRDDKVADWLDRYPKKDLVTDATFDKDRRDWAIGRLVELGGRDRDRSRRRRDRRRHRGLDRAAGRLEDGPRLEQRLRRTPDQQPPDLARPLRDLPDRARRLPEAADDAEPRPRRAALVLGLALVLQPRGHLHGRAARVSADGVPAREDGLVGLARWARARASGVAGLAARIGDGLPRRIPPRPQRARLERHRRRLLGRGRGESDRERAVAVRAHAAGGEPEGVRAARMRRARSGIGSRRTAAASPRTNAATRTGRSPTSRTSRGTCCSAGAGAGTSCPRRTQRRSPSTCSRSSAWRCSDAVSEGRASPRRSRSPGPRIRSRSTCRARTRTTRSCPCS